MVNKRDRILQAATKMFAYKGFADTSTAELAKITGVAEGTIFYHYKNKVELFLSVLEKVRADIIVEFERYEAEQSFETGMDMMEGYIGFYLYLTSKMEDAFLLLHRHYPYVLARENPVCREHLEAVYNCLVDFFEQAIVAGIKDGSVFDNSPRKTALIIFTMVDGLARFRTYNLYDAGALFNDLIRSVKKILQ